MGTTGEAGDGGGPPVGRAALVEDPYSCELRCVSHHLACACVQAALPGLVGSAWLLHGLALAMAQPASDYGAAYPWLWHSLPLAVAQPTPGYDAAWLWL
eukprot:365126-Chlamydomonas_euryale.AAC.37